MTEHKGLSMRQRTSVCASSRIVRCGKAEDGGAQEHAAGRRLACPHHARRGARRSSLAGGARLQMDTHPHNTDTTSFYALAIAYFYTRTRALGRVCAGVRCPQGIVASAGGGGRSASVGGALRVGQSTNRFSARRDFQRRRPSWTRITPRRLPVWKAGRFRIASNVQWPRDEKARCAACVQCARTTG